MCVDQVPCSPQTPEALRHTPGTGIAPGKALKGGGGASEITVWAGEGVEKEGSGEERAIKMPTERATVRVCCGWDGKQSCLVSISKPELFSI